MKGFKKKLKILKNRKYLARNLKVLESNKEEAKRFKNLTYMSKQNKTKLLSKICKTTISMANWDRLTSQLIKVQNHTSLEQLFIYLKRN
jgi:hypothetical protein